MSRFTNGWIKIHRSLDKHWVGSDAASLGIFIKLLMWANYKDSKCLFDGKLISIKRGQVLTSIRQIAASLKLDRMIVKRRLDLLINDNVCVTHKIHRGTIITICNYEQYQRKDDEDNFDMGHRRATDTTTDTTTDTAHIKELKNKRIKEGVYADAAPNLNMSSFMDEYRNAFKQRYGVDPPVLAKEWAVAKRVISALGPEAAIKCIQVYLRIGDDPWFVSHRHRLSDFEKNLNSIKVYAETGKRMPLEHTRSLAKN